MTAPSWVLVDFPYLCYRAFHTVGGLQHGDVGTTGVLYGFLTQLRAICRDPRVGSNKVCLFLDSSRSLRKEAFPGYKIKREQRSEEVALAMRSLREQRRVIEREVLPLLGVRCYRQPGLESDDLIASAALQIRYQAQRAGDKERHAVVISGDSDLWQLISRTVHWYDPGRRRYLDYSSFKREKGIPPRFWGRVKALAGCKSDSVPGVPGVGEKTAVKYFMDSLTKRDKQKRWAIESRKGREVVERNTPLVVLPHEQTTPVVLKAPKWNQLGFAEVCERFGLRSFEGDPRWREFFEDEYAGRPQAGLLRKRRRDR